MAINPETLYSGKVTPSDANYPYGSARNVTVPGDGTGTPLDAAWLNDFFGFGQAILSRAAVTPSGSPETAQVSQYLETLLGLAREGLEPAFDSLLSLLNDPPPTDSARTVAYFGGWAAGTTGPKGGARYFKTGATYAAPSEGTALDVADLPLIGGGGGTGNTTGQSAQAGLAWDANGDEWKIEAVNSSVSVAQMGAVGDDVASDTAAINDAAHLLSALGGGDVIFPEPAVAWRVDGEVNVPVDVNLRGAGRYVYVTVRAGTYTSGYAFLLNTTNGTDWVVSSPNNRSSIISGLRIETDQTIKCFAFSGSPVFEDLTFKFFEQSIVGSSQYNDLVVINRVACSHNIEPSVYQVELNNTGDAVLINQLHCFNVANDPARPLKSIKVTNNAVNITNFLGGDIELVNCTALSSMRNIGMDGGKIIIDRSHLTMEDVALSALDAEEAIEFRNDTSFTRNVSMSNVTISHDIVRDAWEPYEYDIRAANGFSIDMHNVCRRMLASDNPSSRTLLGVQINNESGSPLTAFNKYSHFYSVRCRIEDEQVIGGFVDHPLPQTTLFIFTGLASYASIDWKAASGTYYYTIVPYWDVGRQISRNTSAERSLALTNGGSGAILEIGDSDYSGQMILRVYRGTAANTYDAYADVTVVDSPSLVDNGNTLSGVPWIARAAGPITTTPNSLNMAGIRIGSNQVVVRATAAPTQGTWNEGDEVENTTFTVDANNMIVDRWKRITTGSGNVLGTDWVALYASTVSPAT